MHRYELMDLSVKRIDIEFDGTWVEAEEFGRVRLAALSDGYLTTLGQGEDADWRMIRESGFVGVQDG